MPTRAGTFVNESRRTVKYGRHRPQSQTVIEVINVFTARDPIQGKKDSNWTCDAADFLILFVCPSCDLQAVNANDSAAAR
jgi:hypothetical protein